MARVDGRRARGDARKRQLVDAALVVIGRDGLAGLTHRSVAEEAGVPLASASYHFSGIGELIATAMQRTIDGLVERLQAIPQQRDIGDLARLLADEFNANRGSILADYEAYLYLARRPEPERGSPLAWLDVLCDAFAPDLDPDERRALQATIDGVGLHALVRGEPLDAAEFERILRLAWPRRTEQSVSHGHPGD